MFKCILCHSKSKSNTPVEATKKVNEKLTLAQCIQRNLSSFANTILDGDISQKYSCTNCYIEFVNFYEFLSTVEHIYEKLKPSEIKKEPNDWSDNFVEIFEDRPVLEPLELIKPEFLIKPCYVKLHRFDEIQIKSEQMEVSHHYEIANDEVFSNASSTKDQNDECHDSDFEWPQQNDDWLIEKKLENVKKWKHKTCEENDNDYDPEQDPAVKAIKKKAKKKWRKKEHRHLPREMLTPEILATEGNLITIDGVTYRIPRQKRQKVAKPKVTRGHKRSLDPSRRPHPAFDAEGEQRIRNFVEVRCHVCGEEYLTFFRLRKHIKKCHPGQQGYLVCCNKKYTRRYELLDHLERHDSTVTHECQFCNDRINYKTMSALRSHIKTSHITPGTSIGDNDHICENCGKVYATANGLKLHLESHSVRSFECSICHQEQLSLNALKSHMKMHKPQRDFTIQSANEIENLDYDFVTF